MIIELNKIFSILSCIISLGRYLINVKHWKGFKETCFEMFMGAQVVNMKIVMEPLRKKLLCLWGLIMLISFSDSTPSSTRKGWKISVTLVYKISSAFF